MNSEKSSDKTFSRKKKNNNNNNNITNQFSMDSPQINNGNQLVIALASQSKSTKTLKSSTIGDKLKFSIKNLDKFKKKKPDDSSKSKQKQKIKAENGDITISELKKKMVENRDAAKNGKVVVEETSECSFPTNRIVRIIKSEGSDYRLSQEAIFLINKATEKFIDLFSEEAYGFAAQEKKSFVGYKHLFSSVGKEKRLDFLSDFVPEKITAEKALAERKAAKTLPS